MTLFALLLFYGREVAIVGLLIAVMINSLVFVAVVSKRPNTLWDGKFQISDVFFNGFLLILLLLLGLIVYYLLQVTF